MARSQSTPHAMTTENVIVIFEASDADSLLNSKSPSARDNIGITDENTGITTYCASGPGFVNSFTWKTSWSVNTLYTENESTTGRSKLN